jgi:hypothetical protein
MTIRFPSAFFSFVMLLMLIFLNLGMAPVFSDPDTAWHLAAGDLIRAHGLPVHDSWSFTAAEQIWYNLSWLFDACASALVSLGGLPALYTATLVVFAGSIAFMADYSVRRGASPAAVGLMLFPTIFIVYIGVLARPNMVSVVFSIAFYCLLYRYRIHGNFMELLLLPVLMVLWVNMHGGFLLAFLLIGLFLCEACVYPAQDAEPGMDAVIATFIHRWRNDKNFRGILSLPLLITFWMAHNRGWILFLPVAALTLLLGCADGSPRARKGLQLTAIMALCLGATLINPYGFGVFYGAFATLNTSFAQYVMEWKPIEIGHNIPFTVWLLIALCIGSFTDKRIAFVDRLLGVAMIVLSLSSVRHSLITALLLMPYLTLSLTSLLRESRIGKTLQRSEAVFIADMQHKSLRVVTACMVLCAITVIYTPWLRDHHLATPIGFPTDSYPSVEAQYILDHYPQKRFLNHYDLGGYLVYLWRGKQKDFVDGRASSLFSEALLKDYADFMNDNGFSLHTQNIAHYYRIDGLIMPNDAENAANFHANPAWKAVYRGPVATVYLSTGK